MEVIAPLGAFTAFLDCPRMREVEVYGVSNAHPHPEPAAAPAPAVWYQCQRCGNCCRWPGFVQLRDSDIAAIAGFLQMSERDFIQRYTCLRPNRYGLALIETGSGACVFLPDKDCAIQPVKPHQCKGFPNSWNLPGWRDLCEAIPQPLVCATRCGSIMKTQLLLLVSFFLFFGLLTAGAEPLLQPHDRVAFCGDASTANLDYSIYVEEYLLACQPVDVGDIAQFGWSARTERDFAGHLDTDLFPFKPTVVMTSFGASEADDKPLDDETATAYRKTQTDLVDALKKSGVRTIIVGSPKCADLSNKRKDTTGAEICNKNLSVLAGIDRDVAAKEGVGYADVFGATTAAMTKARALYGDKYIFDDGRPGSPCSLIMAYAYLKALGYSGDIGSLSVEDFATNRVKCSPGQWITYKDHTLTVESTLFPFWWYRGNYPDGAPTILKCVPFDDELNRYLLIVKNLPASRAKITWGTEDHDFTAEELAAGINLAREYVRTPFSGLFDGLTHCVDDQRQLNRAAAETSVDHAKDIACAAPWNTLVQSTISRLIYVAKHSQRQVIDIQPLAEQEKQPPGPIPVILDTDMSSDCDDVGALALLNSFMVRGESKLIACAVNVHNSDQSSGATVHAINCYYGHTAIPIGAYHGEAGSDSQMSSVLAPAPPGAYHGPARLDGSHYTLAIHRRFDPDFPYDDKLPAGVDIYRKALASAADGTVVICSVGLMGNLQDLLQSQPDKVSDLNGIELVRKKVREMVVMANTIPQDAWLLSKWPTRIVWSTFVGSSIYAGKSLGNTPENNPVRAAYGLFGDNAEHNAMKDGRQCWDLTAAWLAVRGAGEVWDETSGYWKVDPHPGGYGAWIEGDENQRLVIPKMTYPEVSKLMEAELACPPKP